MLKINPAPGTRVLIRDVEWLTRRVDTTPNGGKALRVIGLSELVKHKEAIFLTEIESNIQILDAKDTKLVTDSSSYYRNSLLYMESLLRQTPPTDENIYVGAKAVIDSVPYQLDPALQALRQPRQRILIADAVGLGKTIEVGILLSELIKRGKAKRILVLAVKSMLTQFQKELWSRFTIPLTRLDSLGVQRIRSLIPTNHNPFYYYDKSIISIDTLKQDSEYRTYLENCYWDVIVIDEAHNVAERGTRSMRSRLAKLLATRSDTLIMLTATPHDGKARSFASLMNMLNPTAIADPENYQPEDIKGLFIRRFKKDIIDQVSNAFQERKIDKKHSIATDEEEQAFNTLTKLQFQKIDQRRTAGKLFKTTLEKSLFSSPAACLQTICNRFIRLRKENVPAYQADIKQLTQLANDLKKITPRKFSKYQTLLQVITDKTKGMGWIGKDTTDRLVIFTERIETLKFLQENLVKDLNLKEKHIAILRGDMSDTDQQAVVESFGKEEAPVRLLVATDVASEGINLHFLCHKMIHFDIPWSLMVFQQRNGRIDRYGQEKKPHIVYLMTDSTNAKTQGDIRILELLIEKEKQVERNIGDPSALMGVYDIEEEEQKTAEAIEEGQSPAEFEAQFNPVALDPLSILMGENTPPTGIGTKDTLKTMPSLFEDDYMYLKEAFSHLRDQSSPLQVEFDDVDRTINFTAPKELEQRFKFFPKEIWPEQGEFILSAEQALIQEEIKKSRKDEKSWPRIQLLWEQHPVVEWINDKVVAGFARQEAPVLIIKDTLAVGESIFIISGVIPNRKSHPLIHRWFGVRFRHCVYKNTITFEKVLQQSKIDQQIFPNQRESFDCSLTQIMLPQAVEKAREWMNFRRKEFQEQMRPKLLEQLQELEELRIRKHEQLHKTIGSGVGLSELEQNKKTQKTREIDKVFDDFCQWIEDTLQIEDTSYIQIVAVLHHPADRTA